jgi:hypothetical protein
VIHNSAKEIVSVIVFVFKYFQVRSSFAVRSGRVAANGLGYEQERVAS